MAPLLACPDLALEPGPINSDPRERKVTLRRLNLIAIVAIADALLLAVLLWASLRNDEDLVHILGPIHGGGFLALLGLCGFGWFEGRWDWWFPALVVVTLGPPGSLIGDYVLRRKLQVAG
jgi:hypothetical protein